MIRRVVVIFSFVLGACVSYGQLPQYQAQIFGEEYGFGGGSIYDAFEDNDRFIWAVTAANVQRFNGRSVKRYLFKDVVVQAMCDGDGRIWVFAGQSLWRNRPARDDFERVPFDTSGNMVIRGIFQMRARPLMLLTSKGLYAWHSDKNTFELYRAAIPTPGGRHSALRIDTCGSTLFYTAKGGGVQTYNLETGEAKKVWYGYEFHELFALTPELGILNCYGKESYWIDFKSGALKLIDPQQYGLDAESHKITVTGCAPLGNGRFLLNTKFGLCAYDVKTDRFERQQVFSRGQPIAEEFMMGRIFMTQNGTAWAVTSTNLLVIRSTRHSIGLLRNYHFAPPNQWDNRIYGMACDDQGRVWLTGSEGFKQLNLRTGKVTVFPNVEGATNKLSHPGLRGIGWDGRYVVLGPTNEGVWLFDPRYNSYRRPVYASDSVKQALEGDFIDYVAIMRNGDQLICGRFNLYRIQARTYQTSILTFPGNKDNTNSATQDSEGRIWVATNRSVICLDSAYRFLIRVPVAPELASVALIFERNKKEMLLAGRTGLYKLWLGQKEPTITHIASPADGHPVVDLFQDSLQRYWICSHNGLLLGDSSLKTFRTFDFSDNIQSNVFSTGGVVRAKDGLVLLGGANGINYFYPERIPLMDDPLRVTIASVDINDGDSLLHDASTGMHLGYRQNTLAFEVVAPYYNNAAKVQYRYYLRGRSHGPWVNVGSSGRFRLLDLAPGAYELKIAASITGKTWYESDTAFKFAIAPPYWQTWWFRLLVCVFFFCALAFLVFYREERLRKHQAQQLEMEKLQNTNLRYQLETEQVVNYFSQSIHAQHTVDAALWDVAQQCISRLGWEDCVIYLLDPDKKVLVQKAAWGQKSLPDQQIANPIAIPVGEGIVGTVAATGKAELVSDTSTDPRYIVDDMPRQSELAVPIFSEGRIIGVIDSENSQRGFYAAWHLQILTAIATLCGHKIALLQAEDARTKARHQLEEKEKSLLEVEKRAAQMRLVALTNHLNPHFLFNSLTSLNSLIFENQQLASDYLQHLSKVYRYLLQHQEQDTVPLRQEVEFLQHYIFLLKTRFNDDIQIDLQMPNPGAWAKGIVPITLQILIENAVKHNVISAQNPLRIQIEARYEILAISNNVQKKKQVETSNQQGLQNLQALYQYLSDKPLQIVETDKAFIVTLPLL